MNLEKNVKHERGKKGISAKYKPIFELKPIDPVTKVGDAVTFPHTHAEYTRICKGLLPRWNSRFAPMHWVHSKGFRDGKRVIIVQRDK